MKKTKGKENINIDNLLLPISGFKGFVCVTINYYKGQPEFIIVKSADNDVLLKRNLRAEANPLK